MASWNRSGARQTPRNREYTRYLPSNLSSPDLTSYFTSTRHICSGPSNSVRSAESLSLSLYLNRSFDSSGQPAGVVTASANWSKTPDEDTILTSQSAKLHIYSYAMPTINSLTSFNVLENRFSAIRIFPNSAAVFQKCLKDMHSSICINLTLTYQQCSRMIISAFNHIRTSKFEDHRQVSS